MNESSRQQEEIVHALHFYWLAAEYCASGALLSKIRLRILEGSTEYSEYGSHFNTSYYLMCHALELALKAFLRAKGTTISELKDIKRAGHNLEDLLKKAQDNGLDHVATDFSRKYGNELKAINAHYQVKGFEYIIPDGRDGVFSPFDKRFSSTLCG